MTDDFETDTTGPKHFLYAEECGLALMKNCRTGQKLGLEKDLWTDIVVSIKADAHPGAAPPLSGGT